MTSAFSTWCTPTSECTPTSDARELTGDGKESDPDPQRTCPCGGYSQGIAVGDFVITAGMGPADPATGDVVGGNDVAEQTR